MKLIFKSLLAFLSLPAVAQSEFKIGDSVEVVNIGKGIIVSGYQKTEWNYGTYQVHLDGEKYCNNHVLDTRYDAQYIRQRKQTAGSKEFAVENQSGSNDTKPTTGKQVGSFAVGDTVLYTQTSIWKKGIVKDYDAVNRRYTLQDVYVGIPCHSVAKPTKVFDNEFFVGTWNVSVSGANYTTVENGRVWDNVSGGMKLFPLVVRKDGTYTWRVAPKKVLNGRWRSREDAPGIVIINGIDGKDWVIYETTEGFATTKNTKDEIRFHHMASSSGPYIATRVGVNRSCVLKGRNFTSK